LDEAVAQPLFKRRLGDDRLASREQWRQFGVAPGAIGPQRRAVAAMPPAVAVARLAATFALDDWNGAKFSTPSHRGVVRI
jgi:hypothetical protein